MNVNDLIKRLGRMFPRHADEIEAWGPHYIRRLGGFDSDGLEQAIAEILDGWTHSYPPKPEIFRAAAPMQFGRSKSQLRITRTMWPAVYADRDRLVGEWVQWNAERLEGLDWFQRWHVLRIVRDEAFLEAQSAAAQQRRTQAVDIPEGAWATALGRAGSQQVPVRKPADDFLPLASVVGATGGVPAPEGSKALPGST